MSDNNFEKPEAPASWDQYARMLKDLPAHQAPAGLYSRIESRIDAQAGKPAGRTAQRPAFKWALAPALAVAGLAGVLLLSNTGDDAEINTKTMAVPVVNDSLTKNSRNARRSARRIVPPMIQADTALQIDTSIPPAIAPQLTEDPIVPGIRPQQKDRGTHPVDVTTGGPRRDR